MKSFSFFKNLGPRQEQQHCKVKQKMSNRGMDNHHHHHRVDPYHGHPRGGGDPYGHPPHPRGGDPYHPYPPPPPRGGYRGDRGRGRGISNAPAWMTSSSSYRGRPPPPPRNVGRKSGIYFSSMQEERAWVENRRRARRNRPSLFDAKERKTPLTPYTIASSPNNDNEGGKPSQQTRHARRLYIGHLPVELTEDEVHKFFRECINTAMEPNAPKEDPIVSVYINVERRFAFVELNTIELCSACLALDGINVCGKGKVKIKRPNDYASGTEPVSTTSNIDFDVSKLGIVSGTVPDGPNKIFIGGLPYHLTEQQVMELLGAFGTVKAFHLVKSDPTSSTSKGYCFVEYANGADVTPVAVMGLNGMDMGGGKILSARIAANPTADPSQSVAETNVPPIPSMSVVNGIDVNMLLDAAMGLRPMPTLESLLMEQQANAASLIAPPMALPSIAAPPIVAPPIAAPPAIMVQTRVLVLHNMVSDQDFATEEDYNGLVEDVKTESEKFGTLVSYKIPKPGVSTFGDQQNTDLFLRLYLTCDSCSLFCR